MLLIQFSRSEATETKCLLVMAPAEGPKRSKYTNFNHIDCDFYFLKIRAYVAISIIVRPAIDSVGHSSQVFYLLVKLMKILKCILTTFKLSTCFHFRDITVQNLQTSFYFSIAILSVL